MTGYLAMSALVLFALLAVPDFRAAGHRKVRAEAREAAEEEAYWHPPVQPELDELWTQRSTLLGDDQCVYTHRYLDEPVRYDWAGFVEDELARLDGEIARLSKAARTAA